MFQTKDINIWRHFSMQKSLTFHRNLGCVYFRFLGLLRAAGPLKSNFLSNLTSELLTQKTASAFKDKYSMV